MNKILKILSILIIGFVMFSCSTPTNDPTPYIPEPSGSETPVETPSDDTEPSGPETPVETPSDDTEPSGPETPVETPSDDPVEETPEEPTYSITFTTTNDSIRFFCNYFNNLDEFKNLKEGTNVSFYEDLYCSRKFDEITREKTKNTVYHYVFCYGNTEQKIKSLVIGNKNVEVNMEQSNLESWE